jgi:nucleoid-associated protein YgaU
MIAFDRDSGVDVFDPAAPAAVEEGLRAHLGRLGLAAGALEFHYDPATGIVQIAGQVEHQDQRERIVLCCGNVRGVGGVDDRMAVVMPSELSRWRFVQPGDTFESIARDAYRDANRGRELRSANEPLLSGAQALATGWLLRIPAKERL